MTSRKNIVAGNWKMNLTLTEAIDLVDGITKILSQENNCEIIICPSFAFIQPIKQYLGNFKKIKLGAQNCSSFEKGAYTGEVSVSMLSDIGCEYVIIGHSERRQYFSETNQIIFDKLKLSINHKLNPILCVGESKSERESNIQEKIVKQQLTEALSDISSNDFQKIIIAYEPVWAIGTGLTASPEQAQEMHAFIRACISELYGSEISESTSILYGGSCNPLNAKTLFANKDVDGGLIGGASLKADDFCQIISAF